MLEPITASFVITQELKDRLKEWATGDDRSLSATLRQILEAESRRRAAQEATQNQLKR